LSGSRFPTETEPNDFEKLAYPKIKTNSRFLNRKVLVPTVVVVVQPPLYFGDCQKQ
jgi:hypothetical protein